MRPRRREYRGLRRPGLSPSSERWFRLALAALVVLFALGWVFVLSSQAIAGSAPALTRSITANPLAPDARPDVAFLLDRAIRALARDRGYRGVSGAVRVIVRRPADRVALPDSLPPGVSIETTPTSGDTASAGLPPEGTGIWNMLLRASNSLRTVPDLGVIDLVPLSEKRNGRIGGYAIGDWPYERGGRPKTSAYARRPG